MIDWDKPIEKMDGRKARVIAELIEVGRVIYVEPSTQSDNGDVFLVNPKGYRCDDRAIYSKRQEPIVRNVPVKREGWVIKYKDQDRLWDRHIYSSEKSALDYSPVQTRVVRIEWEE